MQLQEKQYFPTIEPSDLSFLGAGDQLTGKLTNQTSEFMCAARGPIRTDVSSSSASSPPTGKRCRVHAVCRTETGAIRGNLTPKNQLAGVCQAGTLFSNRWLWCSNVLCKSRFSVFGSADRRLEKYFSDLMIFSRGTHLIAVGWRWVWGIA